MLYSVLNIIIGSKYNANQQSDFSNLFLIYENLDDAFLIAIFLRIILPIAYQVLTVLISILLFL